MGVEERLAWGAGENSSSLLQENASASVFVILGMCFATIIFSRKEEKTPHEMHH